MAKVSHRRQTSQPAASDGESDFAAGKAVWSLEGASASLSE